MKVFIGYKFNNNEEFNEALTVLNSGLPDTHAQIDSTPMIMIDGKKGLLWPEEADSNTYVSILSTEYGQPSQFTTDVDFEHPGQFY